MPAITAKAQTQAILDELKRSGEMLISFSLEAEAKAFRSTLSKAKYYRMDLGNKRLGSKLIPHDGIFTLHCKLTSKASTVEHIGITRIEDL